MEDLYKIMMTTIDGRILSNDDKLLMADSFDDTMLKYIKSHDDPLAIRGLCVIIHDDNTKRKDYTLDQLEKFLK